MTIDGSNAERVRNARINLRQAINELMSCNGRAVSPIGAWIDGIEDIILEMRQVKNLVEVPTVKNVTVTSPCVDPDCKKCLQDDPKTWYHPESASTSAPRRCSCGDFASPNGTCNWGSSGCYNCPA